MPLTIRHLTDPAELDDWHRAVATGFLRSSALTPEELALRSEGVDPSRLQGGYEDGRCVATYRTVDQQLTLPGGAVVPATAVTQVTTTATHRRRGLLSTMMRSGLTVAKERGDACATLIAAEYRIYGRFGFGPATWTSDFEVEVPRAGLDSRRTADTEGGRLELVDAAELRKVGPACHERFRTLPGSAGAIDRTTRWWEKGTGLRRHPDDGFVPAFHVVYRDAGGEAQGFASYTVDEHWDRKLPKETAKVTGLTAVTPAAERSLWRHLLSLDWVSTLHAEARAPDDVLPLLLPDPRAARTTTHGDFLWLRPLDVPRLLQSRSYPASGRLVLDLHDAAGLAGGRFALDAGPEGAHCAPSRGEPDLSMDIGELGALCLGDESATRLVALGRVAEEHPGAAARMDLLFRTPRRPWCPDSF